jgi:hypothetical protein
LAVFDDGVGPEAMGRGEVVNNTWNTFMLLCDGFFEIVYLVNAEFVDGTFIEKEGNDEDGDDD